MGFSAALYLVCIMLAVPSYASASGGGPILLLFNGSVFILGQIWIIGIEFIIVTKLLDEPKKSIIKDIIIANLQSTLWFAFLLPVFIVSVGLAGSFLPGQLGNLVPAVGTWVHDTAEYGKLSVFMAFFWFSILSVLTAFYEASVYRRRWKKRGGIQTVSPLRVSFLANSVSHVGLLIAVFAIWHEII